MATATVMAMAMVITGKKQNNNRAGDNITCPVISDHTHLNL